MDEYGVIDKLWGFCNILRDDGIGYGDLDVVAGEQTGAPDADVGDLAAQPDAIVEHHVIPDLVR